MMNDKRSVRIEKVEEQCFLTGARKRLIESFVFINLTFSATALSFNGLAFGSWFDANFHPWLYEPSTSQLLVFANPLWP